MSPITSHVLDTALGKPAEGVPLRLEVQVDGTWRPLASRTTNRDGRVTDLMAEGALVRGLYRIVFDTATYLRATGQPVFYPLVEVVFMIETEADGEHYHIPLLLSPFGYSTYRGS